MTPKEIADELVQAGCELKPMNDNWTTLTNTANLDSDVLTAYYKNRDKVDEIMYEDYHNAANYD